MADAPPYDLDVMLAARNMGLQQVATITSLGDSRIDQGGGAASAPGQHAHRYFLHSANALLGQRLTDIGNFGVSGDTTTQMLARLTAALARRPNFIIIWGFTNDVLNGVGDDSTGFANIQTMAEAALAVGTRPILVTEAGSSVYAADATKRKYVLDFNQRLREYAESRRGVILFDEANAVLNPINATLGMRSGYSADGTHRTNLGGYAAGKAFAALMGPILNPVNRLPTSRDDVFATTPRQTLDNGLFTTLTGGTISTNASGTVPSNYTAFGSAGAAVAVSSATNADGYGSDIILTATGGSGDSFWLRNGLTAARYSAGDIVQGVCEVTVASPVNIQGVYLSLDFSVGVALAVSDGQTSSGGGGPTEGYTYTLRTPELVIPAGTITSATMRLQGGFSAASGSVVLNTRRWAVRRRMAAA